MDPKGLFTKACILLYLRHHAYKMTSSNLFNTDKLR